MRPILVTGGAKGFGAEICKELAREKHDIVVHYRKCEKEAKAVVESCQQLNVQSDCMWGDFSTIHSLEVFIESYCKRFPQTKGIVNNVGNYVLAPTTLTESKQWLDLFQTNFFTPIHIIKALLPSLEKEKGAIVNIGTSGIVISRAFLDAPAYATTKSALWFYTRCLAKELAPKEVTVNMVSPGFLETSIDLDKVPDLPMQRPATLKEAASCVAFFFREKSRYITGQNIEIAGGVGL